MKARLLVLVLIFLAAALLVGLGRTWLADMPAGLLFALQTGLLALMGGGIFLAVERSRRLAAENAAAQSRAFEAEKETAAAYGRLAAVFQVSQSFSEASDEREVVNLVLRLSLELIGAKGASFVTLDERGRTLPPMTVGEMPLPGGDAWLEYLAAPAIRQQCSSCKNYEKLTLSCPLLKGSFMDTMGIYCLPLRRGDQEYGIVNLYLPPSERLTPESQAFLRTIIDETTLALEGIRLRKRELATLRQLQDVRQKTDLKNSLSSLLANLHETLEADFAMVTVWDSATGQPRSSFSHGELPPNTQHLIDGIQHSVLTSREPVLLGNVAGDSPDSPGVRSLLAAPLLAQDRQPLGVLLLANRRPKAFTQRQLSMLQTVAGQVALVIQNVNLMADLEFKTVVQERTRLAREIHDGLAQTLGFLKLKVAQMRNYLDHGEYDLLRTTIPVCYESLSEAYQDTREVIDGLRLSSADSGLGSWLKQAVAEFQEHSGLEVTACDPVYEANLSPEVHAQLIRIVQESLSNIRKHAQAKQVWFTCRLHEQDLILEIRDDGCGFDPEDVPMVSKHGLQGMRERAELIGADFQVESRPGEGACVRIRLPLTFGEEAL
jgi:two-component system nitrate/nitrite sensor histidine kinase NarX